MLVHATTIRQYGLISRQQAIEVGLSLSQIRTRVANGSWTQVQPGVYRVAGHPDSWEASLLAATLASGGVASHRCAAALWRLDGYREPAIEITVPENVKCRRLLDVRVHRSRQWDRRDATELRSIPTTGIERTLLDCGAVTSVHRLERLAESAIRQRHTSWSALEHRLIRDARRGRNGSARLRDLLERRDATGTIPLSEFSRLVCNLLIEAGLPAPDLEYRILDDRGALILQADLAWPHLKKAWELDGLRWHFGRTDVERDRRKRNRAIAHGWVIQEILWSMYQHEQQELIAMARTFLSASPNLSRKRA